MGPIPPISELALLLVEDEEMSREMILPQLSRLFKRVDVAVDGSDGLKCLRERKVDLILTDQIMPALSGLDMVREIRACDPEIPIILMTSRIDNDVLLDAINVGINRFLPKPFDYRVLTRELEMLARDLVLKREHERLRRQEMELLRYKDRYQTLQQKGASRKERHVVRNELRNEALPDRDGTRWGIEVRYAPRDIMSGDAYAVRRLPDGKILIFVADAMGSGLSASITAMLVTSFSSYFAPHLHKGCGFSFSKFVTHFTEFASGTLFEEEALSCGLCLLDLEALNLEAVLFGLPPLLVRGTDGSLREVRSANPPFSRYSGAPSYTSIDLAAVADLLIATDGLTDAELDRGGAYREVVAEDFGASPTLASLLRRFAERVAPAEQDDITLLHLRRIDLPGWHTRLDPVPRLEAVEAAIGEAVSRIGAGAGLPGEALDEVELVLTEAVMNAFEHGCLGLGGEEKKRLILEGGYDEALAGAAVPAGSAISIAARLSGNPRLLTLEVGSSGTGIPAERLAAAAEATGVNGRGLRMISLCCDSVYLGDAGHSLIMTKSIH